jgi:hypothetical protein
MVEIFGLDPLQSQEQDQATVTYPNASAGNTWPRKGKSTVQATPSPGILILG